MTLEQRIGQTLMPAVYAADDPFSLAKVQGYAADIHAGGVVLLKGSLEAASEIGRLLDIASPAPAFIAIDAEWGLGMRLADTPVFPSNGQLAANASENLLYEYGAEVARQCRMAGINMVLGPVADVAVEGSRIGKRSFGRDAGKVAERTVAYARGLEDGNVLSVAKHFPGLGAPAQDSHMALPVLNTGKKHIDSVDLLPFRRYIEVGLSGVMAGHMSVPALDASGKPASFSHPILTGLLRNKLGFNGLVLTDALNMGGAEGHTAAEALLAGADIVLAPADTRKEFYAILKGVQEGTLPFAVVNDRCRRILFYKYLVRRARSQSTPKPSDLNSPLTDSIRIRLGSRD